MFFAPSRKLAADRLVHGGPRVYDARERWLLAGADLVLKAVSGLAGWRPPSVPRKVAAAGHILALRLDRLGDLLTTLPALKALRAAAPDARIELGVGSWNEPIARGLPFVDGLRLIDAPWAAWGKQARFAAARRALRGEGEPPDLMIDFQGDLRVIAMMAMTRTPLRAGYSETGGAALLSHRARWDESKSWYWQNMELVRTLFPQAPDIDPIRPFNFLRPEDRERARDLIRDTRPEHRSGPVVGIQPSAGRTLKEWEPEKFAALIDHLSGEANVVLTGAPGDRALIDGIAARARTAPKIMLGAPLRDFAALVESFDLFVTGDTGPMHLSHAVGTPNVAIFGPSDPRRYGPDERLGLRRVVRQSVYCSPCNMIRRPPRECDRASAPDCIAGISVEQVIDAVENELGRT